MANSHGGLPSTSHIEALDVRGIAIPFRGGMLSDQYRGDGRIERTGRRVIVDMGYVEAIDTMQITCGVCKW